jgi:hypothetical protein
VDQSSPKHPLLSDAGYSTKLIFVKRLDDDPGIALFPHGNDLLRCNSVARCPADFRMSLLPRHMPLNALTHARVN